MLPSGPEPLRDDDDETPLDRLRPGQAGVILRIEDEEPDGLRHLATLGLLPGTRVRVSHVAPFGGPLLIEVGSSHYALGRGVAAHIVVRED
jgi:Fe2+ transport system protein FeoA